MLVYYREEKRGELNSTRTMQAETFLNRDYNLASEAYLQCPNCTIIPQRLRTTRKHIGSVHGENVTFECIQEVEGVKEKHMTGAADEGLVDRAVKITLKEPGYGKTECNMIDNRKPIPD